jgi:exopolysaccharide biosynthesis polyprenyl glycosylphosphotransferase
MYLVTKRALDIVAALALLALTGPIMLLIAGAIRLESPGPAIFAQERVGHHRRLFTIYKFRSMRHDAEAHSGPVWAGEEDDRVTSFGRFIRKCRLDELPQVFNVLRGEMSFVGPRPERRYFVDLLGEQISSYQMRHYVQPGITGWAQVQYPYGASIEDAYQKLQYDLYYCKHGSLRFDLLILFKTIEVVLMGRGAR